MGLVDRDDGWRMPDWLWERIEPLLPPAPEHPLGTHKRGIPKRQVMDAILLVFRTGMQWNALDTTGVCNFLHFHPGVSRSRRRQGSSGRIVAPGAARL